MLQSFGADFQNLITFYSLKRGSNSKVCLQDCHQDEIYFLRRTADLVCKLCTACLESFLQTLYPQVHGIRRNLFSHMSQRQPPDYRLKMKASLPIVTEMLLKSQACATGASLLISSHADVPVWCASIIMHMPRQCKDMLVRGAADLRVAQRQTNGSSS